MKKYVLALLICCFLYLPVKAAVLRFDAALAQNSKRPMCILIYAKWAPNYQSVLNSYREVEKDLGQTFNFVEINIASASTLSFNKKYPIYPNVPYIIMLKNNGKIQRNINSACAADKSCIKARAKAFIN